MVNDHNSMIGLWKVAMLTLLKKFSTDAIDILMNIWYSASITPEQDTSLLIYLKWLSDRQYYTDAVKVFAKSNLDKHLQCSLNCGLDKKEATVLISDLLK